MENTVSDNTMGLMPVAIVGDAVAGEAAATLKQVKSLIKVLSSNTFDLAEALHRVKQNKYYSPKYLTFAEYVKDLDIKISRVYYLVKLVEVMNAVGVPREAYEPVGIAKLRSICRLDLIEDGQPKMYEGVTAMETIKTLVGTALQYTPEGLDEKVKELQGLMGDDAMVWLNFPIKVVARKRWEQAVALCQKLVGSVGQDPNTGLYQDASVGRCAELIAENYMQDPNNYPEGEGPNVQTTDSDQVA
jgi:hypothetical protein